MKKFICDHCNYAIDGGCVHYWRKAFTEQWNRARKKHGPQVEYGEVTTLDHFELKHPIPVTITDHGDDDVIVWWAENRVYGSGQTYAHAWSMFRGVIEDVIYDAYFSERDDNSRYNRTVRYYAKKPTGEQVGDFKEDIEKWKKWMKEKYDGKGEKP